MTFQDTPYGIIGCFEPIKLLKAFQTILRTRRLEATAWWKHWTDPFLVKPYQTNKNLFHRLSRK